MKLFYITFLLCGLTINYQVKAQTIKHLNLSEAIQLGLDNSKQLKIAKSKMREAQAATNEMKNKQLPDLDVSGQYLRLNEPTVTLSQGLSGDSGSSGGGSSGIVPKYVAIGQASLSLPLFSGFRVRNGIKSAQYLEKAASLDAESQRSESILNIIEAYVNLYKAKAAVDIVKENLARAEQRVKDFKNMEANGLLAKNDLLKAQLNESNTSLALLNAKNKADVANYNMNLLLGLDDETMLELHSLNSNELPQIGSIANLRDQALQDRKDLKAVDQRELSGETATKIAKGGYWPSIALKGGYMMADVDKIVTLTNAINFGLGVNLNLSSFFKGGPQIQQAKEHYLQTQLMHEQLTDKIKSEVYKTFSNYQEQLQRIVVYETAKKQASENYRIVKNKHNNNLVTTTELLDADVEQFQAELNLEYAKVDAILAYCKLLQVTGQLEETKIYQVTAQ